jgi:hypothetical protein
LFPNFNALPLPILGLGFEATNGSTGVDEKSGDTAGVLNEDGPPKNVKKSTRISYTILMHLSYIDGL